MEDRDGVDDKHEDINPHLMDIGSSLTPGVQI